jgi:membrane protease YdiL (CAAX protease family)
MYRYGFIERHPVLSFYVLTFAVSWGGILAVVGLGGLPSNPAQLARMIPVMVLAMLVGPTLSSILLTGMASGRPGYRDLLTRLLTWRFGTNWYAIALLTAPLVLMVVPVVLSLRSHDFLPRIVTESNKGSLLVMGFVVGAAAGLFEELGWTGFAIPRLRSRFGALGTAAIVGLLWGAWHLPVNVLASFTPSGTISTLSLISTLLFSLALLPAYRILMVLVWDHTGSLLLAMLMHASLTASNIILGATATPGMMGIAFNLALAAAMWIVVGMTAVAGRGHRLMHSVLR